MNIRGLSAKELDQFKKFVNMEMINMYNVLTLRSNLLEGMSSNSSSSGEGGLMEGGMVVAARGC